MKAACFRWITSLVVIFSLIPFQFAAAKFYRQVPIFQPDQPDPAFTTQVSLQGWFHILWGDPQAMQGSDKLLYLLDDGQGMSAFLDLSQSGRTFDELLSLNGKRIALQGLSSGALGFTPGNPILVEEMRILDGMPLESQAVLGSQPFVSILCKFNDVTAEPKNLAFFQNMYANAFPGLDHYWRELSYDQIDLLGSSAVNWVNLPQVRSYYIYDMDSDGELDADLVRLITDCTAAADAAVYFPDFVGVNMMFNADLNGFSYGGGWTLNLDGVTQAYSTTWLADWGYADISVVEHEMGHGFGLPHSSGMYGEIYDNWWDVMSWDRHNYISDPTYGRTGQHTIAYHKDLLGWLAPGDKYTAPQDNTVHTVTIERLALPQTANYKMAILPVIGSARFYTLEARHMNGGYDRNLHRFYDYDFFGIVIHEVDPVRDIPAQVVDYDNNKDTSDFGAFWTAYDGWPKTFIDASDGISVTVQIENATNYTVDIRVGPPFPFTNCASQTQMPQTSCEGLVALYNDADGANWARKDYWMGPEWPCRWYGVSCVNKFGDVYTLDENSNHLVGTIPAEFGNLSSLTYLDLSLNSLAGSIPPELGNLSSLLNLNMEWNQLTGSIPVELGNLANLQYLYLGNNQLTGSIPPELGNLSNLKHLYLRENQLSGSIPASLGNLSDLFYLDFDSNSLTGNIPPELGNLESLGSLILRENQLSGIIPAELGNLSNLWELILNDNQLTGSLPPELGNLANLTAFIAYDNQISGSIPSTFGDLTKLWALHMWDNHLTGSLPEELFDLPNLQYLTLENNALSGPLPANLGNLEKMYWFRLANNQFVGEIPSSITHMTQCVWLDLGYNSLQSSDPAVIEFLNAKDSDWAQTQTIPPQNLQAAQQGSDVLLTWNPILYTGDGGDYEISVSNAF